jgi:hypothetical protein
VKSKNSAQMPMRDNQAFTYLDAILNVPSDLFKEQLYRKSDDQFGQTLSISV